MTFITTFICFWVTYLLCFVCEVEHKVKWKQQYQCEVPFFFFFLTVAYVTVAAIAGLSSAMTENYISAHIADTVYCLNTQRHWQSKLMLSCFVCSLRRIFSSHKQKIPLALEICEYTSVKWTNWEFLSTGLLVVVVPVSQWFNEQQWLHQTGRRSFSISNSLCSSKGHWEVILIRSLSEALCTLCWYVYLNQHHIPATL